MKYNNKNVKVKDKGRWDNMEKVIIRYNKESDTLDIWFGNPLDEFICEEIGDGIILKKDKEGNVIGIEKLYVSQRIGVSSFPLEVMVE